MSKKIKIANRIERVLLTEVLPYETPLIFSNRHFYSICCNDNLCNKDNKKANILNEIFPKNKKKENGYSIPFNFCIPREGKSPRTLSIIHPIKQLEIVSFYEKYKDIMLYYASKSPFSIRKPVQVGQYYYQNSSDNHDDEENSEDNDEKNKGIYFKSFFSYHHYHNVYKFYESKKYQNCEKYFLKLYRFDINKCFDSVYTHSIVWAIYSKNFAKRCLSKIKDSFADKMDCLMRSLNYNETSGILIGSEFARIFAEIILQKIDRKVLRSLEQQDKKHGIHYKIFDTLMIIFCSLMKMKLKILY